MEKYKFLTKIAIADICFEAYGKNLNLLFKHASLALTEVMIDSTSIEGKLIRNMKMDSESLEDLLFQFLEELVYLKDSDRLIFKTFNIHVINTERPWLTAELKGEEISPQKHKLRTDVKAVTYHMFTLKKEKNYWRARVVVDV